MKFSIKRKHRLQLACAIPFAVLTACGGGSSSPSNTDNTGNTNSIKAENDNFSVNGNSSPITLSVLQNDDVGSNARIIALGTPQNGGSISISPNEREIIYSAPSGFRGTDVFNYVISDNSAQTSSATVRVNVSYTTPTNTPPLALPDAYTVVTDSNNSNLSVLDNDVDADGDNISLTAATISQSLPEAAGGVVDVDSINGVINYTPPTSFVGVQTITYTISDGNGGFVNSTAVVTVSPLPVGPVAIADVYTVVTNAASNDYDVTANDVDLANTGLTLSSVNLSASVPAASGSSVSISNGQLSYSPATDFIGVDTVTYTVADANGQTSTGLATFTVTPLAVPPVALPDIALVEPDSANTIDVLDNDVDLSGTQLSIDSVTSIATVPSGASSTVSTDGSSVSYSPATGFIGVETLSYVISDGNGATATGLVTVTVLGLPTAPPPVAVIDIANVAGDSSNNIIDALSNDIDAAANGLTITAVNSLATIPFGASSNVSTDGSVINYNPALGFIGVETLSYTIEDANGASATAAITVVVAGVPSAIPPVAVPDIDLVNADSANNNIQVLNNDIDTTSSGLTVTSVAIANTVPATGTGAVSTDGTTLNYTPAAGFSGVETLSYTITDGNGTTSTSIVTVTVSPLPLPPVAVPDLVNVLAESSNNTLAVLDNDADIASAGLTITDVSALSTIPTSTPGTISTDGLTVSYTPASGFNGVETLSYEITDGNGNTATGLITITVSALAAPPVAIADLITVNQDSSNNSIDVLSNDIDLAGGGITIIGTSSLNTLPLGSGGAISTSGSDISYTPAVGFAGVELIEYEIADGNGTTASGLVTVTVLPTAVVAGPISVPDATTVSQDSSNNLITVISNDVDPASGGLTLISASVLTDFPVNAGHSVSLNGNQIEFTPAAAYVGLVTVQYTVEDVNGATANGIAVITVSSLAIEVPPLAIPDIGTMSNSAATSFDVTSNDLDPAGGGLTISSAAIILEVLPPLVGTNTVAIVSNEIEVTAATGYVGVITVTYEVTDNNGNTSNSTAVITVGP